MNQKNKYNVAIIFGGCSSEYSVSLESASAVIRNIDYEIYNPVLIGITKQGDWFYYTGTVEAIENDTWCSKTDCVPAVLSPNRTQHELLVMKEISVERIPLDIALPILHGKNGEDGSVQGAISVAGIPLAGCGMLASALCMDKERAHKMAECAGVRVPKALVLQAAGDEKEMITANDQKAEIFAEQIGFPLFVKPVKAGSSYGITKVQKKEELRKAIQTAFQYDDEVIIEENIDGFEVGCAVLGTDRLMTGEVDEIELSQGFFDFTEKYTLKSSAIHVPARITKDKAQEIKEASKKIYKALGCSGFARVDCFLTPEGDIVFNEVNTIPGFTEHSRYPGMMKAAGYSFQEILNRILGQAVME